MARSKKGRSRGRSRKAKTSRNNNNYTYNINDLKKNEAADLIIDRFLQTKNKTPVPEGVFVFPVHHHHLKGSIVKALKINLL